MISSESMELTNFHIGRSQKLALKQSAKFRGTTVAEEIRSAVNAYLTGVTPEALQLLDAATMQAKSSIDEMNQMLDATNRRADQVFAELERLRGGRPAGADPDKAPPTKTKRREASR